MSEEIHRNVADIPPDTKEYSVRQDSRHQTLIHSNNTPIYITITLQVQL